MFFKKKPPITETSGAPEPSQANVQGIEPVRQGRFEVFPITKQLNNGRWIVRVAVQEPRGDGTRHYDIAGPMTEFPTEPQARDAGVQHAAQRLGNAP